MAKRTLILIVTIWLLLNGCVKIPESHSTLGKYNEMSDINTECLWSNILLPLNTPAVPQKTVELNSQYFEVLNWNSYKGSHKGWQKDLERLSIQSDLVVLQEGYLTDELQDLFNEKQYHWDIAKAFTYYDIYSGVLTASRVKPEYLCSFRVYEPLSGIPKTALITRYPLSGTTQSLLLVNIHMINFSLDIAAYRAQLEKVVGVLSLHKGPLIISGDFNSWSAERMDILTDIAKQLGVTAVTFDADHRVSFMGRRVDHIFYRKLVLLESFTEKVTTSDHNPMLVTFRVEDNV